MHVFDFLNKIKVVGLSLLLVLVLTLVLAYIYCYQDFVVRTNNLPEPNAEVISLGQLGVEEVKLGNVQVLYGIYSQTSLSMQTNRNLRVKVKSYSDDWFTGAHIISNLAVYSKYGTFHKELKIQCGVESKYLPTIGGKYQNGKRICEADVFVPENIAFDELSASVSYLYEQNSVLFQWIPCYVAVLKIGKESENSLTRKLCSR